MHVSVTKFCPQSCQSNSSRKYECGEFDVLTFSNFPSV